MNEQETHKAADLFAAIGDILLAGAQLARAFEAGILAYNDFELECKDEIDNDPEEE